MMSSDNVRGVTFSHTHLLLPSMSSRVSGPEDTFLLEHVAGGSGFNCCGLGLDPEPYTLDGHPEAFAERLSVRACCRLAGCE